MFSRPITIVFITAVFHAIGGSCQRIFVANATATISAASKSGDALGTVSFQQFRETVSSNITGAIAEQYFVIISGYLKNVMPSTAQHGIHIHEFVINPATGCSSAGDHYNPLGSNHGSPNDHQSKRHVGDLGNIFSDALGTASFTIRDNLIQIG